MVFCILKYSPSRLGKEFQHGDNLHFWVAVFLYDSWRVVDPTLMAGQKGGSEQEFMRPKCYQMSFSVE